MRPRPIERRVLGAIETARLAVPDYGSRPVRSREVEHLAAAFNLDVFPVETDIAAVLLPPVAGQYRLAIQADLGPDVVRHITLHEIGHILCGDAMEPTILRFTGPLPEAEEVADLFSLAALIDPVECEGGTDYVESLIRERVPLDNYGWQKYRIPELAPKVVRMRTLIEERL